MTISGVFRRLRSEIYIRCHRWGKMGRGCRIYSPLKINGKLGIFVGSNVVIEHGSWLSAVPVERIATARLEIGEGTNLGHFNHIYATREIKIGKNVLTADKVYISDNLHSYEDIMIPILQQPIRQISNVEIGDGSWLGEGVCVIGAKIGKGCVIGANAVVTKDVPDYSVAVGVPARVVKHYDLLKQQWEKC